MKKQSMFPEITKQMIERNEKQKDIAKLLDLDISQVSRKLSGHIDWSISDIQKLNKHYKMDFEKLFKRKEE